MTSGLTPLTGPAEPLEPRAVRQLQAQVAAALTHEAQRREAQGGPELTRADEQQFAITLIQQVVSDYLQRRLRDAEDVPVDRTFDERLSAAVYSAMYAAGELQSLLDDSDVENIDINGCDEMWVTYARDTVRGRETNGEPQGPFQIAPTDDELIELIQAQAAHAGINARPWTPVTPQLDLRLGDGSRLSAVMIAGERPRIVRSHLAGQVRVPVARGELVHGHRHTRTVTGAYAIKINNGRDA